MTKNENKMKNGITGKNEKIKRRTFFKMKNEKMTKKN